MRSFPSAFATQLARRDGAAPVWLLKFTAGGAEYVLCQDAVPVTPWSVTALPWIASWGGISEGVDGTLADYRISDLTVSLISDPAASPNLRTLAKARQLIGVTVSVYLWFDGCADAPEEMFRFRVRDIDLPSLAQVELELQDESIRYESYYPGTTMTLEAYPFADPDDIGKTIPLIFGSISKSLTLAADAGAMTSLPSAIAAAATGITVSDASEFFSGMTVQVDDEQMAVTGKSGDILTVTRGVGGTLAAAHQAAAIVWEMKSEFIYLVADHPVTSIPKAYGRVGQGVMDISGVCDVWPAGDHPSYPGQAMLSVPGYITVPQAVDMMIQDGIGVSDLLTILDGITVLDGVTIVDGKGVSHTFSITDGIALLDGIDVSDTITVDDLLSIVDGIGISDAVSISDTIAVSTGSHSHGTSSYTVKEFESHTIVYTSSFTTDSGATNDWACLYDGSAATYFRPSSMDVSYRHTSVISDSGTTPAAVRLVLLYAGTGSGTAGTVKIYVNGTLLHTMTLSASASYGTYYSAWVSMTAWSALTNSGTKAYFECSSGCRLYEAWWEVRTGSQSEASAATGVAKSGTVTKSGSVSKSGTVNRSGSIAKDGTVTKTGTVTKNGTVTLGGGASLTGTVSKSGSVTKSGTVTRSGGVLKTGTVTLTGNSVANTLIGDAILVDVTSPTTAPADVVGQILGTTCQVKGTFPEGYAINGQINTSRTALEWCHDLARQCRAWFRFILGVPTLIVRPDALVPVGSVACVRLSGGEPSHGQRLTAIDDVINTITLCYDRDWSDDGSSDPYRCTVSGSDADSIAAYGTRQRPELFTFDFVTSYAMADSLLRFYLRWYAWQRWKHTQEAYLFNAALEFGDVVTLAFDEGQVGEVAEVGFNPGNGTSIDTIQLTVIE